jgi:hypothetical protein
MLPYINISGGGTVSTLNKVGINISPWSQEAGRPGGPATQIAGLDDALGSAHMTFATAVNNTTYGSGNGLGALTERMRITSVGTVGIGTNNPSSMLDVRPVGTGDAPNYGISHYFPSTYSATVYANQLVASLRFKWYSDLWDIAGIRGGSTSWQSLAIRYNGTEYITIGTNGYVGIGITSPGVPLHIYGAPTGFGVLYVNSSSTGLSSTAGSQDVIQRWYENTGNSSYVDLSWVRVFAGSDWTTSAQRFQAKTDLTWQAFMQFYNYGIQVVVMWVSVLQTLHKR